jgi:hypothetical protein
MDGQRKLQDLPKGIHRTKSGHLRYHAGPHRNDYIHRVVFNQMVEESPFSIRFFIPRPFEIHHINFNKECNCPYNLMALDIDLHSAQTVHGRPRNGRGLFVPRYRPVPWLPLYDEEIPF